MSRARSSHALWVAAVTLVGMVAAASFRSATGALMQPIEDDFGWSRDEALEPQLQGLAV